MRQEEIFVIFMATWIVLGIGVTVFFWKGDLTSKRQWHPWILVITGILFVDFVYAMIPEPVILFFVVPAVVLIQLLNYWCTRFCSGVGQKRGQADFLEITGSEA